MKKQFIIYISLILVVTVVIIIVIFLTRKKCGTCPLIPLKPLQQPGCPKYSLPNFPFNFGGFTRDMQTKVPSQNNPFIGINTEIWTFFNLELTPDNKDLNITYNYSAGLDEAIKRLQCTQSSNNPTTVWLGGLASNLPGKKTPLLDFIKAMINDSGYSSTLLTKFIFKVKGALNKYKCYGVSIDWEVDYTNVPNKDEVWNNFILILTQFNKNKIPIRMEVLPYEGGHYFSREIVKRIDPYVEYWDLMFFDYAGGNNPGYNSPLDGLKCTLENYWLGKDGLNISPSKICVILPIYGYIWPNPTTTPSDQHGWAKLPSSNIPELVSYTSTFLPGGKCQDSRGTQTSQTINADDHITPSIPDKWFYPFNNFPYINKEYVTYNETHEQPTFTIPVGVDPGLIDPTNSFKLYGITQGYVGTFENERSITAKTSYLISIYKKYGSFGGILVWSLNNDKILPDGNIEYDMVKIISKTLINNL